MSDPKYDAAIDPVGKAGQPLEGVTPTASTPSVRPSLLLGVALLSLGVAIATWVVTSKQVDTLRRELASLADSHRELAQQVSQGKGAGTQVIDVSHAPALGREDAVVTLIEYSDYECPFCIRHFRQTMPLIEQNYVTTGKIRYVFRDLPIDQNHPQAIRAHEAARCALEQNKFWDLHARLFSAPGTHTPAALEEQARASGLDQSAYRACIASGRTTRGVRESASVADSLGATGTPWFFVGLRDLKTNQVRVMKPIGGAQPYEQFVTAIDAALKEAGGH